MAGSVCAYRSCSNSRHKVKGLRMFRFPKTNYQVWILNSGNNDLIGLSPTILYNTKRICEAHFRQQDISASGRLIGEAAPLPYYLPSPIEILENEPAEFQDNLSNSRDNCCLIEYPSVLSSAVEEGVPDESMPISKKRRVDKEAQGEYQTDDAYSSCSTRGDFKSKDESELFSELLCLQLRALDENSRDQAMHEINNLMFNIKRSNKHSPTVQPLQFVRVESLNRRIKSSPPDTPVTYESDG